MTKEQFYTYTPIELFDFLNSKAEHFKQLQEAEYIKTGVLCATVANSSGRYKKNLTYKDFFRIDELKKEIKKQSPEMQLEIMKAFNQQMGGTKN